MAEEPTEIFDDLYLGLRAGGALRKRRRDFLTGAVAVAGEVQFLQETRLLEVVDEELAMLRRKAGLLLADRQRVLTRRVAGRNLPLPARDAAQRIAQRPPHPTLSPRGRG